MGKAQSKRSVDITTETKKSVDDEVTEKMEKIEDVDKKDVNGDATVQSHSEKKDDNDDVENDKDITTEKSTDVHTSGESTDDVKPPTDDSKKEDDTTEEISPLSDENSKKSKKEKVKKKWSFRSISFGKKDKQKPGKNEETSENATATVNGTDEEKTSPETEESQKEQTAADNTPDGTSKIIHENGSATEPEINGQKTEEKSDDLKQNEETANTNIPIAENSDPVTNDTAAIITSQETEKSSNATSKSEVIENNDTNSEENTADETSKVGNSVEEVNTTVQQLTTDDASVETTAENKNIPADVETEAISVNGTVDEIHQNGTNNVCDREEGETKAQIEVNVNTDNKTCGDTLEIISSSTSNPSNAPVNFQNLNASGATPDDVGVESDAQKQVSRDLNESGHKNEITLNGENNEVTTIQSKVDEHMDEKFGDEPSPPPLPISPPPSQVSVFAFTNNEEPVDDSLEKSDPINTQTEETTGKSVSLQTPSNSAQESNNENKNSEIAHSISSISTNMENICLSKEEVADAESTDKTNTENNEDSTINQTANKQSCIQLESLEDGAPEVKECDTMSPAESSNNERESLLNDVADAVDVKNQNGIELIENENEISLTNSITVSGENHDIANEVQIQSQDNCQASAIADNINIGHEIINDSSELLSSTISEKNDVDTDCVPATTHDKAPDDIETISDKIDSLVREETKEFANPKDLKESATVAEVKQDPSVTCE